MISLVESAMLEGEVLDARDEAVARAVTEAVGNDWHSAQGQTPQRYWQACYAPSLEAYVELYWRSNLASARAAIRAYDAYRARLRTNLMQGSAS